MILNVSSVSGAVLSQDGILHAGYAGRTLYVTDESGKAVAGPLAYRRSEDDRTFYLEAVYSDRSGREDSAPDARVMLYDGIETILPVALLPLIR